MLVFALDELKLQSNGGRGLTLIDLEPKDALISVAAFTQALQVLGLGRGDKLKEELLKGAALAGARLLGLSKDAARHRGRGVGDTALGKDGSGGVAKPSTSAADSARLKTMTSSTAPVKGEDG